MSRRRRASPSAQTPEQQDPHRQSDFRCASPRSTVPPLPTETSTLEVVDNARLRCATDIVAAWAGIDPDVLGGVPNDIVDALAIPIADGQGPVAALTHQPLH